MSFGMDEEILHDFLIEASEILEQLSEQLVALEKSPENHELLNAIFRGFHTIKGGAGFLNFAPLVAVCHGAENVFDVLRKGNSTLTPEIMDSIFQALDIIHQQFSAIRNHSVLPEASPIVLLALNAFSENAPAQAAEVSPQTLFLHSQDEEAKNQDKDRTNNAVDEALTMDAQSDSAATNASANQDAPSASDANELMTDDEFEKLLDELHGKKAPSTTDAVNSPEAITTNYMRGDEMHGDEMDSAASDAATPEPQAQDTELSPTSDLLSNKLAQYTAGNKPEPPTNEKTPVAADITAAEHTVRVNTAALDTIMNMVGELVLVRNRLTSLGNQLEDEEISKVINQLDVVTGDIQIAVMKTRMQPVKKIFGRFPRVVRDLARSLNKEIALEMQGEDTELDKNLVDALADPMVHLVRNSVDHGIESPQTRKDNNKAPRGTIRLSAMQEGDHILLKIQDDGRGMDAAKLRQLAVERGVLTTDAAELMSDTDAFALIFLPGFSTKETISDISGRGVGMDVVKTVIAQLNGVITIDSILGEGTTITIKVPLTLAILPTLMVGVGNSSFAFPLTNVDEIISVDLANTNHVDGQLTLTLRNKVIPLFYLHQWFCTEKPDETSEDEAHVVIVKLGQKSVAFVVDSLIGQEEVVIKPLDEGLQGTPGMAGATITSDGAIALLLDIPDLIEHYAFTVNSLRRVIE